MVEGLAVDKVVSVSDEQAKKRLEDLRKLKGMVLMLTAL